MPGVLLNQREAAAYLGVSPDLIRRYTRNGAIPTFQDYDGARILYPVPALDAFWAALGAEHATRAS